MAMLEPKLSILDETDSGLDVDAMRIVAEGVNKLQTPETSLNSPRRFRSMATTGLKKRSEKNNGK